MTKNRAGARFLDLRAETSGSERLRNVLVRMEHEVAAQAGKSEIHAKPPRHDIETCLDATPSFLANILGPLMS